MYKDKHVQLNVNHKTPVPWYAIHKGSLSEVILQFNISLI
jgi:hypothetical protein